MLVRVQRLQLNAVAPSALGKQNPVMGLRPTIGSDLLPTPAPGTFDP